MYVNHLTPDQVESYIMNIKDEEVAEDTHAVISHETPLIYRTQEFMGLEYAHHHLNIYATDDKISYENDQKARTIARSSWRSYIQALFSLAEEHAQQEKIANETEQELEF